MINKRSERRAEIHVIACALVVLIICPINSPAQIPAPAAAAKPSASPAAEAIADLDKIRDPATRTAVEQIAQKLALIREYYCVDTFFPFRTEEDRQFVERVEFYFRRPDLSSIKVTMTRTLPKPATIVVNTLNVADGHYLWTQDQLTHEISKIDVAALRAAGPRHDAAMGRDKLLQPFRDCDMAKLKLEKDAAEAWTFAVPVSGAEPGKGGTVRLVIAKSNGALQKFELTTPDQPTYTEIISDVKINPQPSFEDKLFLFVPPAGAGVKDITKETIENSKARGGAQ